MDYFSGVTDVIAYNALAKVVYNLLSDVLPDGLLPEILLDDHMYHDIYEFLPFAE